MKLRIAIATLALGAVGLLSMSACSPGAAAAAVMTPEQSALTALGFSSNDVSTVSQPSPAPSGKHPGLKRLALRRELRKHVEHGQITVETKNGDQTLDVQRGTVTAVNSTSVTVKSTDGFTLTWTFGDPISVVNQGKKGATSDLKTGETVGLAGPLNGSAPTARLVVVPKS